MSRLSQLREFRAKLVRARRIALNNKFDQFITKACAPVGLHGTAADVEWGEIKHTADLWSWYWYASPSERSQMWLNSIAHVDALIEREKGK